MTYVKKKTATIELPVTNDFGIADFSDHLNELQRRFNVERNIKNRLYSFILSNGLGKELHKLERETDLSATDAHSDCINYLFTSENSPLNQ